MNKSHKVEILHIKLYAGREYDANAIPAKWASMEATVYLNTSNNKYLYEVISVSRLGTGSVYNEMTDSYYCNNVDEVNNELNALRETIKYYKDKYEEE